MFTIEKTTLALNKKIEEAIKNGTNEINLTVKATGDKVKIILCSMADIKSIDDVEYFMMECRFPWAGSSKIEDIANLLNNWQARIDDENDDKLKLRKYYEENYGTDEFNDDWFSDWHKDVYGFRPHNGPAWL